MKELIEYLTESVLDKSILDKYKNDPKLNISIKDWYHKEYKNDSEWTSIVDCTFKELLEKIFAGDDTLEDHFAYDSIIRERLFNYLAKILKVSYSKLYDTWWAAVK